MSLIVHELPEWKIKEVKNSRKLISVRDILEAEGVPQDEIAVVLKSIRETTRLFERVAG